jgi:parallel beta-helix repeat protein
MSLTKATYSMISGAPINVLDYGADNTGAADCSAQITAALAVGTNLYFPKGTYKLTASVTLPVNTSITGNQAVINVAYDGVGFNIATGRSNGIAATVTSTHTNNATFATTNTTAVVSSTTGYAAGDLVVVAGTNNQSFFAYIQSIASTTITFDDYCPYTLTSPTLYKLTPSNVQIDGLTMYHGIATPSAASYLINADGTYITVSNCKFGNSTYILSRCVSGIGAYNQVIDSEFNLVDVGVQMYNAAHWLVSRNTITNFISAIRAVFCDSCSIVDNLVQNGRNLSYGLGIELTAQDTSHDKNCRNLVQGNTIISANKGVAGSGIGGIHLNFQGNYNRIIGNTSRHNSFGIYLENNNSYNTIDGNVCSDNDGYYGVGIELDFDNKYNTISNNVCNNNRGSTNAAESCGIQIRDYTTNPNLYNTITANACEGNGLEGIRCGGNFTTVTGNVLFNNAVDVVAMHTASSTSKGWGIRTLGSNHTITGNIIKQDSYDSRATSAFSQLAISVEGGANLTITGNYIYGGYYVASGLSIYQADNVIVANNTIVTESAVGSSIGIDGLTDIYVNTNFISQTNNGNYAVALINVNRYSFWGNVYTGATSTSNLTGSTNRYTLGNN